MFLSSVHFVFETGSHTGLYLTDSAGLAGQQAPRFLLFLPLPSAGVTGMCCHAQILHECRDLNSGLHACHSKHLPTELPLSKSPFLFVYNCMHGHSHMIQRKLWAVLEQAFSTRPSHRPHFKVQAPLGPRLVAPNTQEAEAGRSQI